MGKLKDLWQKRTAKFRALINITVIFLCLFLTYIFLGSPVFSPIDAFRRAEKANFLSRSEILAHISTEGLAYDHLILAQQDDGAVLYTYQRRDQEATELIYAEKTNGMALIAAPMTEDLAIASAVRLPLALFHSSPDAATAELELNLQGTFKEELCRQSYHLTAAQAQDNVFLFQLQLTQPQPLRGEGYLLNMLQIVHNSPAPALAGVRITADVRLFDSSGTLIKSQILTLRPN